MKENSIVEDRLNIYQIGYYLDCKNHIRGVHGVCYFCYHVACFI